MNTFPATASAEAAGHAAECVDRDWVAEAVRRIEADFNRSADTHLLKLDLPRLARAGVDLYLKDESTHPSGSLKHRLARSLFLYGLCNGWIRPGKPVVEASSGSTAISEAYFARLLGIPFIAIAPRATARPKIEAIEFYGGEVRLVEPCELYDEARRVAENSAFFDFYRTGERSTLVDRTSRIEGIGRPRVEASFIASVVGRAKNSARAECSKRID